MKRFFWVKVYQASEWEIAEITEDKTVAMYQFGTKFPIEMLFEIGDEIERPEKYKL